MGKNNFCKLGIHWYKKTIYSRECVFCKKTQIRSVIPYNDCLKITWLDYPPKWMEL